jgi:hypothetical protein
MKIEPSVPQPALTGVELYSSGYQHPGYWWNEYYISNGEATFDDPAFSNVLSTNSNTIEYDGYLYSQVDKFSFQNGLHGGFIMSTAWGAPGFVNNELLSVNTVLTVKNLSIVPEPSTFILLFASVFSLLAWVWRQSR